jgi:hypothetical protein
MAVHPAGELIGPRAPLAPKAGGDDWLAAAADEAVAPELPLLLEPSLPEFVAAIAVVGLGGGGE